MTVAGLALAFLLLLMPVSERSFPEIGIAAAFAAGTALLSGAWNRTPRLVTLGVPVGYLLVVSVLRDAAGGGSSGFGGLYLLPIIYLALFAGRSELLVGLAVMTAANVAPVLIVGKPEYPVTTWRGTLVQVFAAAVAGFTIQHLVGQARAYAAETVGQNERLREVDRMKDEFVSLVSHELRTPLTSIIGYLEMLNEDRDTLAEAHVSFLDTMSRNVRRLSRLVDDLLFVSRIDERKLRLQKTSLDLGQLLQHAADAARPAAAGKDVAVSVELGELPGVQGDSERLAQLVDNLVSNAVKFTPTGGHVAIRASNGHGHVRVEISDTGVGIPPDELDRLFERFYRATTARTSATPGTGLGLAISQSIAEAHGTHIDVASEIGEGTTFSFELPAA